MTNIFGKFMTFNEVTGGIPLKKYSYVIRISSEFLDKYSHFLFIKSFGGNWRKDQVFKTRSCKFNIPVLVANKIFLTDCFFSKEHNFSEVKCIPELFVP